MLPLILLSILYAEIEIPANPILLRLICYAYRRFKFLLIDKKRYQAQLSDQKRYMAPADFNHKSKRWKDVLKTIDKQIAAIDEEIGSIIAADPVLKRQKELLLSIAGLTPYKYDSGSSVRSKAKTSKRANQTMKALLHMSAINVATRIYKDYYERKLKAGKHIMCILNVIRAKLVHRMFSVIRRDAEYTKQYSPAS